MDIYCRIPHPNIQPDTDFVGLDFCCTVAQLIKVRKSCEYLSGTSQQPLITNCILYLSLLCVTESLMNLAS